jgi:hypothetical protein
MVSPSERNKKSKNVDIEITYLSIPRRPIANRGIENGSISDKKAMDAFGLNQCWNPQGCILKKIVLSFLDIRCKPFP